MVFDENVLLWLLWFFFACLHSEKLLSLLTEEPMSTGKKSKERMKTQFCIV